MRALSAVYAKVLKNKDRVGQCNTTIPNCIQMWTWDNDFATTAIIELGPGDNNLIFWGPVS